MNNSINISGAIPEQPQKVTHWKKLTNPNYIGAWDFQPNETKVVTIVSVTKELVKNQEGKDEPCIVMKIAETQKPMILNKTNCKLITKVLKTPHIEKWAGHKITLFVTPVRAFGDTVDAIRVKTN